MSMRERRRMSRYSRYVIRDDNRNKTYKFPNGSGAAVYECLDSTGRLTWEVNVLKFDKHGHHATNENHVALEWNEVLKTLEMVRVR